MSSSSFSSLIRNFVGKTVFLFTLGCLLISQVVRAGTLYWDPDGNVTGNDIITGAAIGGTGTWDTVLTNWFDGTSSEVTWTNANNDNAVFSGAAGAVTLGEAISALSLSFTNASGSYTISGNTLTLGTGGGTVDTGGGDHIIDSVIAGSVGLTKAGAGTLTLGGDNTFTGNTTITGGTLRLEAADRIPNGSAVSVSAGATFDLGSFSETVGSLAGAGIVVFNSDLIVGGNNATTTLSGSNSLTGSGTLIKTGTGIMTISGDNTNSFSGKFVINNGTLAANSNIRFGTPTTTADKITINGGTLRGTGTFTLASTRGVVLGANGATMEQSTAATTMTIGGIITGARLTKIGPGIVVLSSANNTFTDGITISNGTVSHNGEFSGTLGSSSTSGTIPATTITNYVLLNGTNCVLAGSRVGNGATWLATTKGITLNGGGVLDDITDGTSVHIYSGVVGGSGPLIKTGGGILAFAGASTYTGPTIISNGTVRIRTTSNRLPTGTDMFVYAPGVLDPGSTGGNVQQVNSINGDGKVTYSASSTLIIAGSSNSTLSGIISDGAFFGNITKQGTGVLTLGGVNTYDGLFTLTAGTTTVNSGATLCGALCDVAVNGGTMNLNNAAQSIENLTGTGGTINLNTGHVLSIGPASASTYSGVIAGAGGIAKTGTKIETLFGTNTYSGTTTVSVGKLFITSANAATGTYSVAANAALGALQTTLGSSANVSDLNLADGGAVEFDFASLGFPTAKLLNVGTITVNGSSPVNVKGFDNVSGPVTLLEYTGARSGGGAFVTGTLPPRTIGTITDDTANQKVIFNATATDSIIWVSDASGIWNVNTAANPIWKQASDSTATYYQETVQGDVVRFDDTATGLTTVNIPATVIPYKVTVDNSSQNYSFLGAGKISGVASLTKSGTGQLTITNAYDYTNGTILNAGVLRIGNNSALGTGKLTINGGAIRSDSATTRTLSIATDLNGDITLGDATDNGALTLQTGAWRITGGSRQINVDTISATISSIISQDIAGRALTKTGNGTLSLTAANTFSGGFTHNGGTVRVNANTSLGTASTPVTLANGTTLSTSTTTARTLTYNWTVNGDITLGQTAGGTAAVTLAGPLNFAGTSRTIAISNATDTILGNITNGGLVKTGTGILILSGTNAYGGGTTVSEGILQGTTSGLQGDITNNATVVFSQTTAGTYAGVLSGSGTVVKTGSGSVTLTGANTYFGATTISNGALLVNGSLTSASVSVNSGGTLGGTGTVQGPVTVNAGGSIGAGASAGILTLTNGLDLAAGGTNVWELATNSTSNAGTDFDQIALSGGNLGLGGSSRLLIKFIGTSTTPTNTDAFWQSAHSWKIISLSGTAANSGLSNFAAIDGTNGIAAGAFSTSVDGNGNVFLTYTATASATGVVINPIVGAGTTNAQVSWSSVANTQYTVEYKTNLNQVGWLTLTNIQATGTTTTAVDNTSPVQPERYYRVVTH